MLKGYKTYLCSAVIFVVGGLLALGVISQETATVLTTLFGGAGLAALRAAK